MKLKLAFAYDSAYPWFNGGIEKRVSHYAALANSGTSALLTC